MLSRVFREKPVIGAVRSGKLESPKVEALSLCPAVFLLDSSLNHLSGTLEILSLFTSPVFLHIDLCAGLTPDESALFFIKEHFPKIEGIISTRSRTLSMAKKAGFSTVLRLFMIDSESFINGIKVVRRVRPDALELLPGLIFPKVRDLFENSDMPPLICGGFIRTAEEVHEILDAGASAISTSCENLWLLNRGERNHG